VTRINDCGIKQNKYNTYNKYNACNKCNKCNKYNKYNTIIKIKLGDWNYINFKNM
jgi:hypothetical protein